MQDSFPRPSVVKVPQEAAGDQTYLDLLVACGAYYNAVLDPVTQNPIGPLVGYSGRYHDEASNQDLQYVGYRYFNLARLEQYPHVEVFFAAGLARLVKESFPILHGIVSVPDGGTILGYGVAGQLDIWFVGMQKKTVELATATAKEQTKLALGRHEIIDEDMHVVLCEDLVNNFSTTDKAIETVENAGARVVGFICGLNRSEKTDYNGLPVVSLVHKPTAQYRQDDPAVTKHIEAVGFLKDVKPNWATAAKAMAEAEARGIKID